MLVCASPSMFLFLSKQTEKAGTWNSETLLTSLSVGNFAGGLPVCNQTRRWVFEEPEFQFDCGEKVFNRLIQFGSRTMNSTTACNVFDNEGRLYDDKKDFF